MRIAPFALERFYERWEFRTELMLSSSDCESRAVAELLALEPDAERHLLELRLGYTEVPGSEELRTAIAARYEHIEPGDVLTLAAAEEGIFVACHGLLEAGDHAVIEGPCYGSALELAGEGDVVLLSDEVYRGLEHDPSARLAAACDRYHRAISLGTVSKAYGLPGLRIGWLASRDAQLIERVKDVKLYTTICSSAPSELLVALAVRHTEELIAASRELVLSNLPVLDSFLERRRELFAWVRPAAGPVGFPRVERDIDVHAWCEQLAAQANVLLLPGSVYGQPRHVRLGFGRANLPVSHGISRRSF